MRDCLANGELTVLNRIVEKCYGLLRVAHEEEHVEHEVGHLGLAERVRRLNRQVGEETVVALEAEHVDGVSAFGEEALIEVFDEFDCVLQEGLRVQRIRVEVQRKNRLVEHTVEPEGRLFLVDDLEDSDQDLRLALVVDERAISFVIGDHDFSKLLLHMVLGKKFPESSFPNLDVLLGHIEVEINPRLIRLDRANRRIGRAGRLFERRVVVLLGRRVLARLVAFVGLLELNGAGRPQPELLSHVRVQIVVPDPVALIRHVDHAEENYVALRARQSSLLVQPTPCIAAAPGKLIDAFFEAAIGTLRVHSHRFQALLDGHMIALQEELQLSRVVKVVGATDLVLLLEPDALKMRHLVLFALELLQCVLDSIDVQASVLDHHLSALVFFGQDLLENSIELLILLHPLVPGHRELADQGLREHNLV